MKIIFTGGGTGGHFYPIIAVAEKVREIAREEKMLQPNLYYLAPSRYNPRALFDKEIEYRYVPAGKMRRYFSLLNFTDLFKTFFGFIKAFSNVWSIYPDVVFSKGGFAAFPTLLSARILRIPVLIHESDSVPGKVTKWSAKFAKKIAVSYPEAVKYFDKEKTACTGNPIREEISMPMSNGAHSFLKLEENVPTILVLGGSQGAQNINDNILDSLNDLLKDFQIIHQTGRNNLNYVNQTASVILKDNTNKDRYKTFDYMNDLAIRMSSGIADIIISRAGSTIFEIAAWGIPSIIIPIHKDISHDQTENAFAYSRAGACKVIEEDNLTPHVLISEIRELINNKKERENMRENAKKFSRLDSANKIARQLIEICLEHEK